MPQPAKIPPAAGASRFGERLITRAIDHQIVLGVLFLAICGWKFTFGLEYAVDLRLGDETKYLGFATGYSSDPLLPEWSPLYVYFYKLEQLFEHDPVRLFFLHQKILVTLLPIAFFIFLAARSVPLLLALPSAVYLMISVANLPVGPKTLHLAVALMFLALALFLRLGSNPAKWGLMVAVGGILSLIRAEYLIPLAGLTLYAIALGIAERRLNRGFLLSIGGGLLAVAALYSWFGSPLFGGRSLFAFEQHFALNYMAWGKLHQDPWTADYHAIFHTVFGQAQSIPAAFVANPAAFLHHMLTNSVRVPIVLAGLFFGHFNLLLPRFEGFTLAEAGILALLLLGAIGYRLHAAAAAEPWRARLRVRDGAGTTAFFARLARSSPDIVCLLIFLVPFALMMVILYPRYHYGLAFGIIVLALAMVAAAPYLRRWEIGGFAFLALPILLAIVPSVGSTGARVDKSLGDTTLVPRPALATVEYLRGLGIRAPVRICESADPGVGAYVGRNFQAVPEEEKARSLGDFVTSRDISIIVADDRMRRDPRFERDPEWANFQNAPRTLGFSAHVLRESGVIIYIKDELLRSRGSAPAAPG